MSTPSLCVAVSILGLTAALASYGRAQADELRVLAGGAMAGPLRQLASQFERVSGQIGRASCRERV